MPQKSGFSHALAAVLSFIVGAIALEFFKPVFPFVHKALFKIGIFFADLLNSSTGIHIDPVIFSVAFIAFILSFLWGVLYHYARR